MCHVHRNRGGSSHQCPSRSHSFGSTENFMKQVMPETAMLPGLNPLLTVIPAFCRWDRAYEIQSVLSLDSALSVNITEAASNSNNLQRKLNQFKLNDLSLFNLF